MRTLDEENDLMQEFYHDLYAYPKPNDLSCTKCGNELADVDGTTLACFPPKRKVKCYKCGFEGYRYV